MDHFSGGTPAAGAGGDAASDLAHATTTAVRIDTHAGLGAEGLVWLDVSTAMYLRDPENAARIRTRLEAAETRAMQILERRKELLIEMAADLGEVRIMEDMRLEGWLGRVDPKPDPHCEIMAGKAAPVCPEVALSQAEGI